MSGNELWSGLVGYQVRALGTASIVGDVESVHARGFGIHRIPGHPAVRRDVPGEAIAWISHATRTVFLAEGIDAEVLADAPPLLSRGDRGGERWWANVLGHDALYASAQRGGAPLPHRAER